MDTEIKIDLSRPKKNESERLQHWHCTCGMMLIPGSIASFGHGQQGIEGADGVLRCLKCHGDYMTGRRDRVIGG